jgi:hypothetical protein|tara:strand:- start:532 stop:1071 length:540 start_codon:yes stop_codon:yes gene_type:complete
MKCWEFVEKFVEFEDAQDDAPIRKTGEEHLLQCEKCRRYSAVVSEGLLILKEMPPEELPEKFWASLEHRIFHVRDEKMLKGHLHSSVKNFAIACSFILIAFFISNSYMSNDLGPDIELPAIIVSKSSDGFRVSPEIPTKTMFVNRFWSDINGLMYEYSTMSERYRTPHTLRQTDLVEYK